LFILNLHPHPKSISVFIFLTVSTPLHHHLILCFPPLLRKFLPLTLTASSLLIFTVPVLIFHLPSIYPPSVAMTFCASACSISHVILTFIYFPIPFWLFLLSLLSSFSSSFCE
jgi:hypothetical protein